MVNLKDSWNGVFFVEAGKNPARKGLKVWYFSVVDVGEGEAALFFLTFLFLPLFPN